MDIKVAFEHTRITRERILDVIGNRSLEELTIVPETHNNNLLWNFGHVVVTQHLLSFGVSKLELQIPVDIVNKFRKGSSTTGVIFTQEELEFFKKNACTYVDLAEKYWEEEKFGNFTEYTTSYGVVLRSIEEAIAFNNVHEGVHFGYMLAMRKLV